MFKEIKVFIMFHVEQFKSLNYNVPRETFLVSLNMFNISLFLTTNKELRYVDNILNLRKLLSFSFTKLKNIYLVFDRVAQLPNYFHLGYQIFLSFTFFSYEVSI